MMYQAAVYHMVSKGLNKAEASLYEYFHGPPVSQRRGGGGRGARGEQVQNQIEFSSGVG